MATYTINPEEKPATVSLVQRVTDTQESLNEAHALLDVIQGLVKPDGDAVLTLWTLVDAAACMDNSAALLLTRLRDLFGTGK